jgi:hypothetical protein
MIIAGVVLLLLSKQDAQGITLAVALVTGGIGLMSARDNKVSSEEAGATPEQKQAVDKLAQPTKVGLILFALFIFNQARAQDFIQLSHVIAMEAADAVTNPVVAPTNVIPPAVTLPSGVLSVVLSHLADDAPYITNGTFGADVAVLYNESNPIGKGKVGFFGDLTVPMSQQTSVGLGAGTMTHRSFLTPVTFTAGTTLTNLPAAIGKVYSFVSDGVLYDFTGKQVGNWAAAGFFKNWTINSKVNIGLKFGAYDDSVIPGIGYFGAITGTF